MSELGLWVPDEVKKLLNSRRLYYADQVCTCVIQGEEHIALAYANKFNALDDLISDIEQKENADSVQADDE